MAVVYRITRIQGASHLFFQSVRYSCMILSSIKTNQQPLSENGFCSAPYDLDCVGDGLNMHLGLCTAAFTV